MNRFKIIFLFSFLFNNAYAQDLGWAKSFGNTAYDMGNSLILDSMGNVYTTGYFEGTIDFDPGTNVFNLTSNGGSDIFVNKLDSSGNFVWAIQIGGVLSDAANDIEIDKNGNLYLTGNFGDTVDFDPGSGISNIVSFGGQDIFVCKLDSAGNLIWARQMGGINGDLGASIAVDSSGNVYTTGYFFGTADFDPGIGNFIFTSSGNGDLFISKLNSSGDFVWASHVGSMYNEEGFSLKVDAAGNTYTTGHFGHTVDFDPGVNVFNLIASGQYDIYILKLDSAGNFLWVKQIGGVDTDGGYSMELDNSGNIYLTGDFYGMVDFDPGIGTYYLTAGSGSDIFILKLDSFGNFKWAKRMGNGGIPFDNRGTAIAIDTWGNVYTTGYFDGVVDFDPGAGIFNLAMAGTSNQSYDVFIQKLDALGNFIWAIQIGDTAMDYGKSIVVDLSGNVYTTGFFSGTADFDPGIDSLNLSSKGYLDIFICKFNQNLCSYFTLKVDSVADITCSNPYGFASAYVVNGTPPYNYSWNTIPVITDSFATFPQNGIYQLTVTDDSSCLRNVSILINDLSAPLVYDLNVNLIATDFRPGQFTNIWLDANNFGCVPVSGQLNLVLDSLVIFSNANPVPDIISGDTLTWNFSNLIFDFLNFTPQIVVTTSASAVVGNLICLKAFISPISGDADTSNNEKNYCVQIKTSYDPNEKQVFPKGECLAGYIDSNQVITYTIQFQNTGNANAIDIYIVDSLDTSLNLNSIRVVGHSHNMYTEILPNNVLRFIFNNINLPDSFSNEPLSHGYVIFEMMPITNTISGTSITNNAHIYFDYNSPVITNTVFNTVFNGNPYPSPSVVQNNTTLTSLAIGATYQWVDCDNGNAPISNATNQSYTASSNGNYAVSISENGCTVLSNCFNITTVGFAPFDTYQEFVIARDESPGNYILSFSKPVVNVNIEIYTLLGQLAFEIPKVSGTKAYINISNLTNGMYLLVIKFNNHKSIKTKLNKNQ